MNRNTVKLSYRCLPNMGSYMAKHNSVPGACNQKGVIYQAIVTSGGGKNIQTYVGLAKDFKQRFSKHKTSMEKPSPSNSTTLSSHFLTQKEAGHDPKISWKFLKTNIQTFNPVKEICNLCISEKYHILYMPGSETLNSRSEIFSACRHKRSELLVPPDPKSHGG